MSESSEKPMATAEAVGPEASEPVAPSPAAGKESTTAPPRRGGGPFAVLLALLALAAAAGAFWRGEQWRQGQDGADRDLRSEIGTRIDALDGSLGQLRRELETLRTRSAAAEDLDRSVREELLALGERSRRLEEAVANLAEQRQGARDALARNEAEFLLQQAQERLQLFHDPDSAILAYQLADSALAAAEDPVFVSVRGTIHAELAALEASAPQQTQAGLRALAGIRGGLARLPPPRAPEVEEEAKPRWREILDRFVRIRAADEPSRWPGSERVDRALIALDIREAEAALLGRDESAWREALGRARAGIVAGFDAEAPATRAALAEIDRLASTPMAPALPELGTALRELRNLRITRTLAEPPPAAPAPASPPAVDDAPAIAPEDAPTTSKEDAA